MPPTTEQGLQILIDWLQDNIDCESPIIFDNDIDRTDPAALLSCIEQRWLTFGTCTTFNFCSAPPRDSNPCH